jgi:hypothetical protein
MVCANFVCAARVQPAVANKIPVSPLHKVFLLTSISMAVKRWPWALAALVMAGTIAPLAVASHHENPRAIVLHVNIFNETVSLNGTSTEQSITLAGEVRVDYVLLTVRVAVSASTDIAWTVNITPKEMSFTSSGTQPFTADIYIPPNIYNRTAVLTVKCNATVSGIPADTSSDTASIVVNGPGEGSPPVIPKVPTPKPGGASVVVPNLPILVAAVSAVAVAATGAVFWKLKSRRIGKDSGASKMPRRRNE